MVTLYAFGPFLGTPDSSPFVIKTMMLLKLAGIAFETKPGNPLTAPLGLLPYIDDDGIRVADSTFIRRHIESKYQFDFDASLDAAQKAVAWSLERLCEDHLYFALLRARWLDPVTFHQGLGRHMFGRIPAAIRPLVKTVLRRGNVQRLRGHGLGRLTDEQVDYVASRDIHALAAILADKPYLMGTVPCGADATVFGALTALLTPPLDTRLRSVACGHENLVAYCARVSRHFFRVLPTP